MNADLKRAVTLICMKEGHKFQPLWADYPKDHPVNLKRNDSDPIDRQCLYRMLFCSVCGETQEIMSADYKPLAIEKEISEDSA